MRARFAMTVLCCLLPCFSYANLADQSLEEAFSKAETEGKHVYVAFLGSGWSVSSQLFEDRVLNSPVFQEFAQRHLAYFPINARRKPALTKQETAHLQAWVIHFDIKSYPTCILLGPDGQEVLRHGYRDLEPEAYIKLLTSILPLQQAQP